MTNVSVMTGTMHYKVHEWLWCGGEWLGSCLGDIGLKIKLGCYCAEFPGLKPGVTRLLEPTALLSHSLVIYENSAAKSYLE